MKDLNENYYLRKHYFAKNDVPSQSLIKKKMGGCLAAVYFKNMSCGAKTFAGLQPIMKGGGSDWFEPPSDLLKGKAILRPVAKSCLSKLNHTGLDEFGDLFIKTRDQENQREQNILLAENNQMWKALIIDKCKEMELKIKEEQEKHNFAQLVGATKEFSLIYIKSVNKIDELINSLAKNAIERYREESFKILNEYYEMALQKQALELKAKFDAIFIKESIEIKNKFINNLKSHREHTLEVVHDVKAEKYKTIEMLRNLHECRKLACQLYVAAQEKLECSREIEQLEVSHDEKIKSLNEVIQLTDRKIIRTVKTQKKVDSINKIWQLKVCHVVRKFQTFIKYCLKSIPEHYDFFINLEKLMLLQMDKALEDSKSESIIDEHEISQQYTISKTKIIQPYIIFGDINQKSKKSDLVSPLFMINKHYIYGSCETAKEFFTKLYDLVDMDLLMDNTDYSFSLPVKHTSQDILREQELESSIMRIIENENKYATADKYADTECCGCTKDCLCSPLESIRNIAQKRIPAKHGELMIIDGLFIHNYSMIQQYKTRNNDCKCSRVVGKRILSNYPPYMVKKLPFTDIEMHNYERCSESTIRQLAKVKPAKVIVTKIEEKTKEMGTQYEDIRTQNEDMRFREVCKCYDDVDNETLYREIAEISAAYKKGKVAVDKTSVTYSNVTPRTFVKDRAYELKSIIGSSQYLKEIFTKGDCKF